MRTMIFSTLAILVMGIIVAGQDERMFMPGPVTLIQVPLRDTIYISSSNTAISSPGGSSSKFIEYGWGRGRVSIS